MAKDVLHGHTCDNPGCRRFVPCMDGVEGNRSLGFTGWVVADWNTGGGAGGEWFACRESCIKKAVLEVVSQSWAD